MQKFEMNVTGSYSNDAMLKQISEGVRIDQVPEDSLMSQERMELFPRSTRGSRSWNLVRGTSVVGCGLALRPVRKFIAWCQSSKMKQLIIAF